MRAGATSPAVRSGAFLRQSCATQQRRQLHVRAAGGEQDGQPAAGPGPQSSGPVREFSAYTSVDEWKKLDSKVNTYPCTRSFQAIGVSDGTGAFKADILGAVQSVVGQVHVECINERPSSGGKYTAVRIGPVHVQSGDQVVEIFARIKEAGGSRLKWYM
ncbi:hypothetical protein MNEG_12478 [Monoraphidium neglectum]|uniref:Uncharacterized protein n=1 Tax=Monoraphidium neglectum TaxID=145388 RepID=A0A0D2LV67_9CHLO|nr:hypothetical protein MNEG_12478 [Monoraphidium neglectum]KIY95484.1 hypothetical protein MNEG_12478 [Monoraphidium neglectum]|eukprot:XP_013894504.1 hypothetical protein MNEG_12478 [Monoraphidium neglectum]